MRRRQGIGPRPLAWPGRSRWIDAREVEVGQIVSVAGIRDRATAIMHVTAVDASRELVRLDGRRPWGGGWRNVHRECHPEGLVELLIEDGDQ
jgi:hypothetical protein